MSACVILKDMLGPTHCKNIRGSNALFSSPELPDELICKIDWAVEYAQHRGRERVWQNGVWVTNNGDDHAKNRMQAVYGRQGKVKVLIGMDSNLDKREFAFMLNGSSGQCSKQR